MHWLRDLQRRGNKGRSLKFAGLLLPLTLAACQTASPTVQAPVAPAPAAVASIPVDTTPVIGADGRCTGPTGAPAAAIAPGIQECQLLALKGRAPDDILVGESGKGQREAQVMYFEPTGRELYLFSNNSLQRIVK